MRLQDLLASILPASALLLAGAAVPRGGEAAPPAPAEAAAAFTPAPWTAPEWIVPDPGAPAGVSGALDATPVPPDPIAPDEVQLDPRLGRYVAPRGSGRAILTLDPRLQARLERSLATYRVPWGATVLLEPDTGRVLALAEHSRAEPSRRGIARSALAPAASIFKIVTAAALLEHGIAPDEEVCYHGGRRRLSPRLLEDDPRRDRRCRSLASAFGHSTNVVFAKLAERGLDAAALRATAQRFLFDAAIPFALPVEPSTTRIPEDAFGLAEAAAGFGDVTLSPLHAAMLAAIVANGGVLVPPVLVEGVEGAPPPDRAPSWRVLDEGVAGSLAAMMRSTVAEGTARRAFRRPARVLQGVEVAGKTGSLADARPYRDYSWFVGYAPAERPEVVVATVVVNERLWHARAPTVAREALEAFFAARDVAALPPGMLRTASR